MQIKRYFRNCYFMIAVVLVFLSACSAPVAVSTPPIKDIGGTQTPTNLSFPTATDEVQSARTPLTLTEVISPQLTDLDMLDNMNGWGTTESMLVTTNNGGSTWFDITPPGLLSLDNFTSIYFLNPLKGWVLSPADNPQEGDLALTVDGGLNWEKLPVLFDNGEIKFIDPNIGFILVGRGVAAGSSAVDIYSTIDGGRSWNAIFQMQPGVGDEINGLPFSGQKNGLGVLDSMNIWVGGSIPMESVVYLYVSHDGGSTWSNQELELPAGFESSMTEVMPPQFFDNRNGILPVRLYGTNTSYVFYLTDDGGANWSSTQPIISSGRISLVSQTNILVWDGGPSLQLSLDGGSTWSSVATNVDAREYLIKVDFIDTNTGWMLTEDSSGRHILNKTVDGGATWSSLIP